MAAFLSPNTSRVLLAGALAVVAFALHAGCQHLPNRSTSGTDPDHPSRFQQAEASPVVRESGASPTSVTAASLHPRRTAPQTPAGLEPISPRPGRARPVVAVVGANEGTEVTDYVVPYGVLSASGVVEVWSLGTRRGAISMFPALKVQPQATLRDFDERFPRGADIVVVPAVHNDEDPLLLGWVRAQAERGATVVGICDGVWVLARAGLLAGRRGVGHWYSFDRLEKQFPGTTWVRDERFVADGRIVTTTGVTASVPVSIALVEAVAGRERADSLAYALGVGAWSSAHRSEAFSLSARHLLTAATNKLAFWQREEVGVPVLEGVDEIALALTADAYARTYRSGVRTIADADEPVRTRRGLLVLPDVAAPRLVSDASVSRRSASRAPETPVRGHPSQRHVPVPARRPVDYVVPPWRGLPVQALDAALAGIGQRYGSETEAFVALQLEYAPPSDGF